MPAPNQSPPPIDPIAATPGLRTLGTGAQQALPGNTAVITATPSNHGMLISSATNAVTVLPPDVSTTKVWMSGGVSSDPSWQALPAAGVVAKTSAYPVVAGDTNTTFTNDGASGTVIFTLPAATVGLSFSFDVEVAHILEVLAVGSDVLRMGATQSAAAGNLQSSTIGSTVTLKCTKTGIWSTMGSAGTWAVT